MNSGKGMRVLLLSAYHSASHAYWCRGLMAAFPDWQWTLKTQPARHFSWRVRASDWIWALSGDAELERPYDLIVATSLSGLPALKAHCPALQSAPLLVYFHENQFAHPPHEQQLAAHRVGWQFSSFQNALCADAIRFNTEFNRRTFFDGLRRMLKRMPERLPGDPAGRLEARSEVLPVPLTEELAAFREEAKDPRLIVWNHRWEWDKRPQCFLRALRELAREGIDFRLAMMGCGGGRDHAFAAERAALGARVVHWGEANETAYRRWIGQAGIGVSCALHDFQGLAMLEVAQAGASVIVPNRVAYAECLPGAAFYDGSETDEIKEVEDLKGILVRYLEHREASMAVIPPEAVPTWPKLRGAYRRLLEGLIESGRRPMMSRDV